MLKRSLLFVSIAALCLCAVLPLYAGVVQVDGLAVTLGSDGVPAALRLSGMGEAAWKGGDVILLSAPDGSPIPMTPSGRDGGVFVYRNDSSGIRLVKSITAEKGLLRWRLSLTNKGKEQALIGVRLSLPQVPGAFFWDGNTEHKAPLSTTLRNTYAWTFPMSCTYAGAAGLAAGLDAGEVLSYIENGCGDGSFFCGTRLVLDPGETCSIGFVAYPFDADFGFLSAVERYYELFPGYFTPAPGIDERIAARTDSHGLSDWQFIYEANTELFRRTRSGWNWFYAPFVRAGDFFGREEYQDWEPRVKDNNWHKAPLADRLKMRADRIARAKKYDQGIMYYIIDWCEWDLANSKYSGCRINDRQYAGQMVISPWVHTYTADCRMFWWNNTFARDTIEDLEKINSAYDQVAGFAVDCAEGHAKHRGDGMNGMGGRAWDEKGVYINEQVGIARMMDYIHSMKKKDGRTLGITANHNGEHAYVTAFRADAPINENGADEILSNVNKWLPDRWLLGRKPKQLYCGLSRMKLDTLIDWKNLDAEGIRRAYGNIYRQIFNLCLYLGYYPVAEIGIGHAWFMDNLPVLFDVVGRGWHAVPALKGDGRLYYSRYGDGTGTRLAVSNPSKEDVETRLTLEGRYVAEGGVVLSLYNGSPVDCSVEGGRTTIPAHLASGDYMVLKPLATVRGIPAFKASVRNNNSLSQGEIALDITTGAPGRTKITFSLPEHAEPAQALVNGKQLSFASAKEGAEVDAVLQKGRNTLILRYRSGRYLLSKESLLAYAPAPPAGFGVVVEDSVKNDLDGDQDCISAWWVSEYFRYVSGTANPDPRRLVRPILVKFGTVKPEAEKNRIMLLDSGNPYAAKVGRGAREFIAGDANGNIIIAAGSTEARKKLVQELLSLLDEKFKYYGEIGGIRWFYSGIKETAGMAGMRTKAGIERGKVFADQP